MNPSWDSDATPIAPGWYAVLQCWDPREGILPDAAMWEGTGWRWHNSAVIVSFAGPFSSGESAREWALENDPER